MGIFSIVRVVMRDFFYIPFSFEALSTIALGVAIEADNINMVRFFLKKGARITPAMIHSAANHYNFSIYKNHEAIFKLLLETNRMTLTHFKDYYHYIALLKTIQYGHIETIQRTLQHFDPDIKEVYMSLLGYFPGPIIAHALQYGCTEIAQVFLEHVHANLPVDRVQQAEKEAFKYAVLYENTAIIDRNISLKIDLSEALDSTGCTPLHYALCRCKDSVIANNLLDAGADFGDGDVYYDEKEKDINQMQQFDFNPFKT